jgi:hypothetical protein
VLLPFRLFPAAAALGENALEELPGRFIGRVLGGEPAFEGGFEDTGAVAVEVVFEAVEVGDCSVEAGELGPDFVYNAILFR